MSIGQVNVALYGAFKCLFILISMTLDNKLFG